MLKIKKKKKSLFVVTWFTNPISLSSNLPENTYMLSLEKKWMFDSCLHAPLSMLEVINNTAGLVEVSVQHSGWCCCLFVVFILFIEHAHPFLAIRVCTALLPHLPPRKRMNSHSRMTIKFRNVIFPPPPNIPQNWMLNKAPAKSSIYCMWDVLMYWN